MKALKPRVEGTKLITAEARASHAYVFTPASFEDSDDELYSVMILIPKEDKATLQAMKQAIEAAKEAGKSKWNGKVPSNLTTPVRDGDTDENYSDQEAFNGHYFVRAKSRTKPGIIGPDKAPITDSTEFFSGCYARFSVNFFAYDHKGNKGVACGLNNIQKIRDGEPLGGRARAEDEFDSLDDSDFDDPAEDNDDIF